MKAIFLIAAIVIANQSFAQFSVGNIGMTVKNNYVVSLDGLSLKPSVDLTIENNSLTVGSIPAPGNPAAGINRVYRFSAPLDFSGTATIAYQVSELNGNIESKLQISHTSNESNGFIVTSESIVDDAIHRVSNSISNSSLLAITALSPGGALPVTLIDFVATAEGQAAVLNWSTSSEINFDRFEVERSLDVKSWNEIGQVKANGEGSTNTKYHFVDIDVADGINYYRLKMVDRAVDSKDGSFTKSSVRSVIFRLGETTIVFPNPASEWLQLKDLSKSKISEINVYNVSGKEVYKSSDFPTGGIAIDKLPAGSYILKINRDNGSKTSHTFVKQ